jgi:ketosteroid isomerase-like protein
MEEQAIEVFGKTAIVRFLLNAETLDNQTPGKVKLRVLLVWKKNKNNWLLLARQAVKIP